MYIALVPGALDPSPELIFALARSVLADVPPDVLRPLIESAWLEDVSAGAILWRPSSRPRCGLVVRGLLRLFIQSSDGREVTCRYSSPGQLAGAALLFRPALQAVGGAQAVVDTTMLHFDAGLLRSIGPRSAPLAWALGRQVAAFQEDLIVAFTHMAFGTVRQRVARHLLDMAVRQRHELHVAMSQQTLADAVGTTREVTARALADLRSAGLISTSRGHIQLLDPIGLAAETEVGAGN